MLEELEAVEEDPGLRRLLARGRAVIGARLQAFALSTVSRTKLVEQRWKHVWGRVNSTSQTSTFDKNAIKLGSRTHFDVVNCS